MSNVTVSGRETGAYEAITVSNTALGFSDAKMRDPAKGYAREVFCVLESYNIRYTLDGTTPTSTVGMLLTAGQNLTLQNKNDIRAFRCIRVTSDASLKVEYKW